MSGDYAGDLTPQQAWDLVHDTDAVLVDVRTEAEWRFVGVPALERLGRVEWVDTAGQRNAGFVEQVRRLAGQRAVVLLCRSGQRSVAAAEALTAAGAGPAWNVLDGFEGGLDEHGHRGAAGWRAVGLPWTQG
ncbi:rhodanese-like domain-containing protein [Rhodococcus antarcticus]|jgi:rhodanese-related sulfurtransferase|uniref:Rhodanese-like domain-containing protein n=1 Tax=Rhodococcus antarcticus TaxID=2987751 RepID=A0ABY6NVK7_9NOCA|nr:rhodanese-like domain-containing protein [Rhodococcus antarcticus]UZJ23422.1 rhodanese-like domain-containing protein [Rhodococcus antarcticus]